MSDEGRNNVLKALEKAMIQADFDAENGDRRAKELIGRFGEELALSLAELKDRPSQKSYNIMISKV